MAVTAESTALLTDVERQQAPASLLAAPQDSSSSGLAAAHTFLKQPAHHAGQETATLCGPVTLESSSLHWGLWAQPAPVTHLGRTLTYTAGHRVIPLSECVGHGLAAYGRGPLKQVPWVTLKPNDGACRELRADSPPVSGLGDGAALGVTGARDS